jgi:hypothetical protein
LPAPYELVPYELVCVRRSEGGSGWVPSCGQYFSVANTNRPENERVPEATKISNAKNPNWEQAGAVLTIGVFDFIGP